MSQFHKFFTHEESNISHISNSEIQHQCNLQPKKKDMHTCHGNGALSHRCHKATTRVILFATCHLGLSPRCRIIVHVSSSSTCFSLPICPYKSTNDPSSKRPHMRLVIQRFHRLRRSSGSLSEKFPTKESHVFGTATS